MDDLCNDRERGILIIGTYALWMQRNQRQHGDNHKPISAAVRWSLDTAINLWNLNKPMNSMKERHNVQQWRAPSPGWFKCNTDGAFYLDQGQGAFGVALRNDSGLFVGERARWYPHGLDALTQEALACRDGAVLARDKGVQRLILETDSQEFVKL